MKNYLFRRTAFLKTAFKLGAIRSVGLSNSNYILLHEIILVALLQLLTAITSVGKKGLMYGGGAIAV